MGASKRVTLGEKRGQNLQLLLCGIYIKHTSTTQVNIHVATWFKKVYQSDKSPIDVRKYVSFNAFNGIYAKPWTHPDDFLGCLDMHWL